MCEECGYATGHKSKFDTHLRTHTGKKPFACPHCPFRTAQKGDLTRHIRAKHTGEGLFVCPHCTFRTVRKDRLTSHIRIQHLDAEADDSESESSSDESESSSSDASSSSDESEEVAGEVKKTPVATAPASETVVLLQLTV